jgi:hypothetical protein
MTIQVDFLHSSSIFLPFVPGHTLKGNNPCP